MACLIKTNIVCLPKVAAASRPLPIGEGELEDRYICVRRMISRCGGDVSEDLLGVLGVK